MPTEPAIFIGHGSPMNTLERNRYTESWRALGAALGRPRAILAISAHWYVNASAVTAMAQPRTIHDFYGFPDELFAFEYAAPGAPDVAEEIVDVVAPMWVGKDHDSWGLDHGTWSVLAHLFPAADVPVVQLSINGNEPLDYHLELGARLAPLRDRGVLIVGSGNVVHNLRRVDSQHVDEGFDWARRFDDEARRMMIESPERVPRLAGHDDFRAAVPTPDHFLPLVYLAGLATAAAQTTRVLVDGYTYGSLSMTSYTLGAPHVSTPDAIGHSGELPDPAVVPTNETNT